MRAVKRTSILLSVLAAVAGVLVGRALPRTRPEPVTSIPAAPPVATTPAAAERDGHLARAERDRLRTELAACLWGRPRRESTDAGAPEGALNALVREMRAIHRDDEPDTAAVERLGVAIVELSDQTRYGDLVFVRGRDGAVSVYPADEWPPSSGVDGEIIARQIRGEGLVARDGGQAAYVGLRDLAEPTGVILLHAGGRVTPLRLWDTDAGAP
jgi:hypothetical protein